MNCEQTRELLLACDADAALRARLQAALEHAAGCADCREALGDYDQVRAAVRPGTAPEPPLTLVLPAERPGRATGRWAWPLGLAAAGLLAAGLWAGLARGPQAPAVPALSAADVGRDLAVFDNVSSVFDRRAGWVLVSDQSGNSDMGLMPTRAQGAAEVYQLAVTERRRVIATATVAIVPGQTARWTTRPAEGPALTFDVSVDAGEPRRVSAWMSVDGGSGGDASGVLAATVRLPAAGAAGVGRLELPRGTYALSIAAYGAASGPEGSAATRAGPGVRTGAGGHVPAKGAAL